jgi:hypothetical protein
LHRSLGVIVTTIWQKPNQTKLAFFGLLVIAVLWVIWNDERFLVLPDHPNWQHIAPFKWLLLSSRVPDGVPGFAWNDQLLSDVLWGLVVAAIVVPEFIIACIAPARWPTERLPTRGEQKN